MDEFKPQTWRKENPDKVLVLKTVREDMTAYGGFVWPKLGYVEAPDWDPNTTACRGGLHGWLWGAGDLNLRHGGSDRVWLLVAVDESDILDTQQQDSCQSKVKFRCGEVLYAGTFSEAFRLMVLARCASDISGLVPQRKSIASNGSLALTTDALAAISVGYFSQAMSLYLSNIRERVNAVSVGDCGQAVADCYRAAAMAFGSASHAGVLRAYSTAFVMGPNSYAEAIAHSSTAVACGKYAQAVARQEHSVAFANGVRAEAVATSLSGTAIVAGEEARATAKEAAGVAVGVGPHGAVEATGWRGLAVGLGVGDKVRAGEQGTIVIAYVDFHNRRRLAVGYVGENGIKANTWYRVWNFNTGELEEVPVAECPA